MVTWRERAVDTRSPGHPQRRTPQPDHEQPRSRSAVTCSTLSRGGSQSGTITQGGLDWLLQDVPEPLNQVIEKSTSTQEAADFVDLHDSSRKHGVCDAGTWVEGFVTSPDLLSFVHPNALGHRNAANHVEAAIPNTFGEPPRHRYGSRLTIPQRTASGTGRGPSTRPLAWSRGTWSACTLRSGAALVVGGHPYMPNVGRPPGNVRALWL